MGYLIFARREYQNPLEWIGRLPSDEADGNADSPSIESVRDQALERFGDPEWIEMVAVPERATVRVIPLDPEIG